MDIVSFYKNTKRRSDNDSGDGLYELLTREFVVSKDEKLENLVLEVYMKSLFKITDSGRYLENLFFIKNNECKKKQIEMKLLIQELYALINHSTNTLNVSDIKDLKQVSHTMSKFNEAFTRLYDLFILGQDESDTDAGKVKTKVREINVVDECELDPEFTKLFLRTKSYMVILEFLRICTSVKIEAARNVLQGNPNLGLHAVTVSKELLKVIELCNYILINFSKSSGKARVYFYIGK